MPVPAAAAVGFAGVAAGVTALIVLHRLPTGLSPVADAVSRYGIGDYRLGYRVQTLAYASAAAAVAVGLAVGVHRSGLVVGLCVVFAVSRALISWLPMDAPGAMRTPTGRRHGQLALVAFGAVAIGALRLPATLRRDRVDPGLATASAWLGGLMVATLFAMALCRPDGLLAGRFGLVERVYYVLTTLWLALAAALLV